MSELKAIKTSLAGSIISLLLSLAMLFGTTFAWFSTTISSDKNRIVAGNLDVDLLVYKSGKYVSVKDGMGDIFAEANNGADICWEPGMTKIVFLGVKNTGSLSIKYNLKLNIDGALAGVLDYAILDGGEDGSSGIANWSDVESLGQISKLKAGLIPIKEDGKLNGKNDAEYFVVAVHMPDNAEDIYKGDTITVDLMLAAAQNSYEEDSFGKNHDDNAEYDENYIVTDKTETVTISDIDKFKEFTNAVNSGGKYDGVDVSNNSNVYVKLTDDIDLSEYTEFTGIGDGENNSFDGVFDGTGHIIKNWTVDNQEKSLALFNETNGVDIKNLTVDNFNVGKETGVGNTVGILVGKILSGEIFIDNVTVKNSSVTGEKTVGALVGEMTDGYLEITNSDIKDITIKNSDKYKDSAGVLLGNGYSQSDSENSGFSESANKISGIKWLSGEDEQDGIPSYNYKN